MFPILNERLNKKDYEKFVGGLINIVSDKNKQEIHEQINEMENIDKPMLITLTNSNGEPITVSYLPMTFDNQDLQKLIVNEFTVRKRFKSTGNHYKVTHIDNRSITPYIPFYIHNSFNHFKSGSGLFIANFNDIVNLVMENHELINGIANENVVDATTIANHIILNNGVKWTVTLQNNNVYYNRKETIFTYHSANVSDEWETCVCCTHCNGSGVVTGLDVGTGVGAASIDNVAEDFCIECEGKGRNFKKLYNFLNIQIDCTTSTGIVNSIILKKKLDN